MSQTENPAKAGPLTRRAKDLIIRLWFEKHQEARASKLRPRRWSWQVEVKSNLARLWAHQRNRVVGTKLQIRSSKWNTQSWKHIWLMSAFYPKLLQGEQSSLKIEIWKLFFMPKNKEQFNKYFSIIFASNACGAWMVLIFYSHDTKAFSPVHGSILA